MTDPDNAWRDELCTCQDDPQHIHCPWGGAHVHYVSDDGDDIPPPPGHHLRAVCNGVAYDPKEPAGD